MPTSATGEREPLATAQEIADYCRVPLATVYQWSHRGSGPRISKVGRHIRARWSDLDAWLDAHSRGGSAPTALDLRRGGDAA